MSNNKILIERKDGVSIYGKVVGPNGKLGQYEVESVFTKTSKNPPVYHTYAFAEKKKNYLIGVKNNSE